MLIIGARLLPRCALLPGVSPSADGEAASRTFCASEQHVMSRADLGQQRPAGPSPPSPATVPSWGGPAARGLLENAPHASAAQATGVLLPSLLATAKEAWLKNELVFELLTNFGHYSPSLPGGPHLSPSTGK